jgi:hypothetical protein
VEERFEDKCVEVTRNKTEEVSRKKLNSANQKGGASLIQK